MPRFVRVVDVAGMPGDTHHVNVDHVMQVVTYQPPLLNGVVASVLLKATGDGEPSCINTSNRLTVRQILNYDPFEEAGF